jgi:2-phosphoglycerate kinase
LEEIKNEKYMIYLIGGSPRCGKSILSRKLAKKLDTNIFACDYLRPIIIAYTPKEELDEKFPFIKMYDDIGHSNDAFFESNTAEEMLEADLIEAKTLWIGIKEFIKQKAILDRDIVVEGVQLLPELINSLRGEEYFKNIKVIYLIKENEELILEGFTKNTQNDWLIKDTNTEKTLPYAAKMVRVYSDYFKKEADRYGFKVLNTDDDFENRIKEASDYLTGDLKE